jgi:hypothetical protein
MEKDGSKPQRCKIKFAEHNFEINILIFFIEHNFLFFLLVAHKLFTSSTEDTKHTLGDVFDVKVLGKFCV